MRRSIIIGNWKIYLTSLADASILATTVRNNVSSMSGVEAIIAPPSIWLSEVAQILKKSKVKAAAQNIFFEKNGPFTGEISAGMVKEMADYTIVGHSERREHFGETDLEVNEKVLAAVKAGITPIICVGEKNKNSNLAQPIRELKEAISHLPKKSLKDIIVAYEPLWAISSYGKGESADPDYTARVITKLRELVDFETPILYGGSVKSANAAGFAKRPEIDGALVGAASIRASEFIKICKIWNEAKSIQRG